MSEKRYGAFCGDAGLTVHELAAPYFEHVLEGQLARDLLAAQARIGELERECDDRMQALCAGDLVRGNMRARIAELEATIAGLLACQEFSKTRIAELEVQLSRERSTCAEMIESALAPPGKP